MKTTTKVPLLHLHLLHLLLLLLLLLNASLHVCAQEPTVRNIKEVTPAPTNTAAPTTSEGVVKTVTASVAKPKPTTALAPPTAAKPTPTSRRKESTAGPATSAGQTTITPLATVDN
ncbi:hypothetical protein CRUP_037629, partial [Coryphaenoides rupestris]